MRAAAMSCAKSGGRNAPPIASRHGTIPADDATSSTNAAVPATQFLICSHRPDQSSSRVVSLPGSALACHRTVMEYVENPATAIDSVGRMEVYPLKER